MPETIRLDARQVFYVSLAIKWATHWHRKHVDKAGLPYILHPIRVMLAVRNVLPTNVDAQAAAVLHDTIEDCGVTARDLSNVGLSQRTIQLVEALTKTPGQEYKLFIQQICESSHEARVIKLCDVLDNMTRPSPPEMKSNAALRGKYLAAMSAIHKADNSLLSKVNGWGKNYQLD